MREIALAILTMGLVVGTTAAGFGPSIGQDQTTPAITVQEEALPTPRWGMGTALAGDEILMAGGWTGSHYRGTFQTEYDAIVRYDPSQDEIRRSNLTMPDERRSMAAVKDGSQLLLFGGKGDHRPPVDEVLHIDVVDGTVEVDDRSLPLPLERSAAVSVGNDVYLFGGISTDGKTDAIIRYPTEGGPVEVVQRLPAPRSEAAAVRHGSSVYVFGGAGPSDAPTDTIFRYDLTEDEVEVLDTTLPEPRGGARALMLGGDAFVFGGVTELPGEKTDRILRFDPTSQTVWTMDARLPTPRHLTEVAAHGNAAFVFGGNDEAGHSTDEIVKYVPSRDTVALG